MARQWDHGSTYTTGVCSACGRRMTLKKDGTVRPHGPANRRCSGSGLPPKSDGKPVGEL